METEIVGFIATSTSIAAFSSQFLHTIQTKTTEGISIYRTVFDAMSLGLWVYYAARTEDNPLLLATAFEFISSLCIMVLILKNKNVRFSSVKDYTPPATPPSEPKFVVVTVNSERRNSI